MRIAVSLAMFATLLVLPGCSTEEPAPPPTDTGYEGTWARGNDINFSELYIVKAADGSYRFWLSAGSYEDKWRVTCDRDGGCVETGEGGVLVSEYRYRPWIDDETGLLRVECTGTNYLPSEEPIHFINELVVKKDGLLLTSATLERNGRVYEKKRDRPKRNFDKVSDRVPEALQE